MDINRSARRPNDGPEDKPVGRKNEFASRQNILLRLQRELQHCLNPMLPIRFLVHLVGYNARLFTAGQLRTNPQKTTLDSSNLFRLLVESCEK